MLSLTCLQSLMPARSQWAPSGVYNNVRLGGIIHNPANITQLKGNAGLYLSGMINRAEMCVVPLYNSFDVYIDDSFSLQISTIIRTSALQLRRAELSYFKVGMASYHTPYLSLTAISRGDPQR